MMNFYKVGTNFDLALLDGLNRLNQEYSNSKVIEVYGSDRQTANLSARPDFRLPLLDKKQIEEYVKKAAEYGIKFNYTLNSFFPYGSKREFIEHIDDIKYIINFLEEIGVYRITVANPILLELIRNVIHSDINIELSTCAHIDAITQIKYMYEKYNVTKICNNLIKNRDFDFLQAAGAYCDKNNIIYELMVNEFCGVGGIDFATHCVYRDSCYMCHATNKTLEDANSFNEYPMRICSKSRNENPANWLKLRFIRPEDIPLYNEVGINHFKITGRTGSTDYILKTVESYMKQDFDGNILNLWKPLESIKENKSEFSDEYKFYDIPNKSLNGFLEMWTKQHKKCEYEVCGETCKYCDSWYDKYCK